MKSMESDVDRQNYPSTAPPPYPGPPENPNQPYPPHFPGTGYPTYSTYPNNPSVTVVQGAAVQVVPGARHVVITNTMSPKPATYTCPSCHQQIITRVESNPTIRTHLLAVLLCLIGCWPCVCVPYCTDSCSNSDHYCPNCSAYIGSYVG